MRIIAGKFRGRILHPPKGLPVRPTTDLAKESLFNILNNRIDFETVRVLDLFAGTGNISLEFASRGATEVVAIDQNAKCVEFIRKSSLDMGFNDLFTIRGNVFGYLKTSSGKFDIIFADPPYDLQETITIPDLIFGHSLLESDGWLVIEHDAFKSFVSHANFVEERRYGKVHFSFFRVTGNFSEA